VGGGKRQESGLDPVKRFAVRHWGGIAMKTATALRAGSLALMFIMLADAPAFALEKLKAAVAQKGSWGSMFADIAAGQGFHKEQGLDVTLIYTQGGAETIQALTSGSVDVVSPAAIWAAIAAYAKGAPVRIVASEMYGLPDILWVVPGNSPIKGPADLNGKRIAFSRTGSVTHMGLMAYLSEHKVKAEVISTGNPSATRTMLLSGQIDVGFTLVPQNLDLLKSGEYRLLFTGNDTAEMRGVARTIVATSTKALAEKRDLIRRYLVAHFKAVDFVYHKGTEAAIKQFAADNKMDLAVARESLKYYKPEYHTPLPIHGLETANRQAVAYKMIDKPLTPDQLKELVEVVYDPGKK
jgi:NitT/TauT family transport system substrate-binding protein